MAAAGAYRGVVGDEGPQVVLGWWLCHVLGAALLAEAPGGFVLRRHALGALHVAAFPAGWR